MRVENGHGKINRIFVNLRRMTWQMDSIVTVWIAKAEDRKNSKSWNPW